MELTAENFDETLERLSAKYIPGGQLQLTRFGIVWNIGGENFNKNEGTGGLWRYRKSPTRLKVWKLTEAELQYESNSLNVINKLVKNIPRFFQKHSSIGKKYWNTNSSYGSKHFLSEELDKENPKSNNYCANGEFILAMWILDYEMKPCIDKSEHYLLEGKTYLKDCNPNVTFNCSYRDLNKVVCECGLQYTKASKKQHERSKSHNLIMDALKIHTTPSVPISPQEDSTTDRLV
jgi:hypothetical protein